MKHYNTEADAGSVKIGINGRFTVLMPNGYGDGDVDVYILEEGEKAPDGARFLTSVEGEEINVYAYDCDGYRGGEIVTTLSGRFGVYSKDTGDGGSVYFELWH